MSGYGCDVYQNKVNISLPPDPEKEPGECHKHDNPELTENVISVLRILILFSIKFTPNV